ncbi:MAG TPA: hypothetical protein VGR90_06155 [Acidimicrobiales bacterium]|nr:hypothetical protein [Acidimicrobiales bacterium]
MTLLGQKVFALHRALERGGVPHAFGGAIALAYAVNEARATHDIDINIFLLPGDAGRVLSALPTEVRVRAEDGKTLSRDGQVRLRWGDNPVDLFLSTVPLHDVAARRTRSVPFETDTIPIVSATDLTVFKAMYGRGKDWVDIEAMRDAGTVDGAEAIRWVEDMLGADHDHHVRLLHILSQPPRPPTERDELPPALRPGQSGQSSPGH